MDDEYKRLLFLGREAFWTNLRGKENPYAHVNLYDPTPEQRAECRRRHAEIMAELAGLEIPDDLRAHPYTVFPNTRGSGGYNPPRPTKK